jgi:hypothetical protein
MPALVRRSLTLVLGASLAIAVGAPAGAHEVTVVADGLDNPRQLDFGPADRLYVAESGRGGDGPCIPGPDGDPVCLGATGAVTRVDLKNDRQERVTTGLPSLAAEGGGDAIGPSDVAFAGWPHGGSDRGFLTIGLGAEAEARDTLGGIAARMATLYRFEPGGDICPIADLGEFEAENNPDAAQPESDRETNPDSVDASAKKFTVVADAGGNDILAVHRDGSIERLAVIPFGTAPAPALPDFPAPPGTPLPVDSVPTSVVRGPDGAWYVGQLTGFPFPKGGANVWRIVPGEAPEVFASGFTQITDLAFGEDGSLFVLEFATEPMIAGPSPGALIRVRPDGSREELAAGELTAATGLTLDRHSAFVSHHGNEAGTGEVVRIALGDED